MEDHAVVHLGPGESWAHRVLSGGIAQHLPQTDRKAFK